MTLSTVNNFQKYPWVAQVSKIQESSTDYRKFYLHNGAKVMRLRAETKCAVLLFVLIMDNMMFCLLWCVYFQYRICVACLQRGQMGMDTRSQAGKGSALSLSRSIYYSITEALMLLCTPEL